MPPVSLYFSCATGDRILTFKIPSLDKEEINMFKFFCTHTLPPGALTQEQICQVSEASQHETDVKGYRSFFNLTKGKVWCVVEAKDREALVDWF